MRPHLGRDATAAAAWLAAEQIRRERRAGAWAASDLNNLLWLALQSGTKDGRRKWAAFYRERKRRHRRTASTTVGEMLRDCEWTAGYRSEHRDAFQWYKGPMPDAWERARAEIQREREELARGAELRDCERAAVERPGCVGVEVAPVGWVDAVGAFLAWCSQ